MKNVLCHVSDKKYDVLKPIDRYIYFSENNFISYFGQYLYIFDKQLLIDKYGVVKQVSKGLCSTFQMDYEFVYFKSKELGGEWISQSEINTSDAICILEHWNHMEGVIGKRGLQGKVEEIGINLMLHR